MPVHSAMSLLSFNLMVFSSGAVARTEGPKLIFDALLEESRYFFDMMCLGTWKYISDRSVEIPILFNEMVQMKWIVFSF